MLEGKTCSLRRAFTTIAWIGRYRRMSKDYEYLTSSSEAMVYLAMLRLMLTRLAKQNEKQFVTYKLTRAA
jgi:hypothetical protein